MDENKSHGLFKTIFSICYMFIHDVYFVRGRYLYILLHPTLKKLTNSQHWQLRTNILVQLKANYNHQHHYQQSQHSTTYAIRPVTNKLHTTIEANIRRPTSTQTTKTLNPGQQETSKNTPFTSLPLRRQQCQQFFSGTL
jgi:hypothetical protein